MKIVEVVEIDCRRGSPPSLRNIPNLVLGRGSQMLPDLYKLEILKNRQISKTYLNFLLKRSFVLITYNIVKRICAPSHPVS